MCCAYKVHKHMRPNFVVTTACERHFREKRCCPWTETLVCVALEAGI
jgi:hypothetical protein